MFNLGCADKEAAEERNDGGQSPTPSADTQAGHPKGAWSVVRKRYGSSQTISDM